MPTVTDNAIVIRRWDFSETSQTVSLLTREHGIIRGLAKGAKREKGAFSGGLDLLTEGEIVAIVKTSGGSELATLTAWHLQSTHRVLRENLAANRAALYMADLVHHMLIDHDPHPRVFDALSAALAAIDADPAQAEIALLRLQWTVIGEAGYQPELQSEAHNASAPNTDRPATVWFSAAAGGVLDESEREIAASRAPANPVNPGDRWRVRRETIELLRDVAGGADVSGRDSASLRRANRLLAAYCREIIGSEPPAMRWAFPDLAAGQRGR